MEGGKVLPGLSECSERSNESVDSPTRGRLMNYVKLRMKMFLLLLGWHME